MTCVLLYAAASNCPDWDETSQRSTAKNIRSIPVKGGYVPVRPYMMCVCVFSVERLCFVLCRYFFLFYTHDPLHIFRSHIIITSSSCITLHHCHIIQHTSSSLHTFKIFHAHYDSYNLFIAHLLTLDKLPTPSAYLQTKTLERTAQCKEYFNFRFA